MSDLTMRITRMAAVPAVCIRCGARLDLDQERYDECPSLGCLCENGPVEAKDALEALDTIMKLADPENDVGDRMTLTSCYEVAQDALKAKEKDHG